MGVFSIINFGNLHSLWFVTEMCRSDDFDSK
jgi:hypothetical protein